MSKKKSYKYCVICNAINNDVPSFGFPKDESVRNEWISYCHKCGITPMCAAGTNQPSGKLCAEHFLPEDIVEIKKPKDGPSLYRLKSKKCKPSVFTRMYTAKKKKSPNTCFLCDERDENISYFTFPRDIELRKSWLVFCEYPASDAEKLGKEVKLCEKHFEEKDIIRRKANGKPDILYDNVKPKIFTPGVSLTVLPELNSSPPRVTPAAEFAELDFPEQVNSPQIDPQTSSLEIEETVEEVMIEDQIAVIDLSRLSEMLHENCPECLHFLQHISNSSKGDMVNSSDSTMEVESITQSNFTILATNGEGTTSSVTDSTDQNVNDSSVPESTPKCARSTSRKRRLLFVGDIKSPDLSTPNRAKRNFSLAKSVVEQQRYEMNKMQKKLNRMQNKAEKYQDIIKQLRDNNMLSATACEDLLNKVPIEIQQMIERLMKNKNAPFPPELRTLALNMQYYSSAAYNFLRKAFHNLLPHENTLRKWYMTVDGQPGFTKEAFDALKWKTKNSKAACCLVADEIALKDHVDHDRKRSYGYQDLGTGLNPVTDTLPHATHALVFLLVSLKEKWKIPVAYFLIHSLTSEERANLVRICLGELSRVNVDVVAFTFDGTSVNLTMCKELGAEFNTENPQFEHPITKKTIFIYPDPCHMIKLVRNTMAETGPLFNGNGEEISWNFIEKLQRLEDEEGLRVATKLTRKHIEFGRNKMNVRLAVQVFSESVKTALLWLHHDLNHQGFVSADATAEFCGIFNDIFDLLNVRSKFCKKPSQILICRKNFDIIKESIEKFSKYIRELSITKVVKKDTVEFDEVINSGRKTGFMGLLICLKNIIPIFERINEVQEQEYLLPYKLLQDSIENFFSAVRQRGGYNNNPTARSFEVAYKRLLVHFETRHGGNCTVDDIQILRAGKSGFSPVDPICDLKTEETDSSADEIYEQNDDIDHGSLSRYVTDINHHMAGFVVHKLVKLNVCRVCETFLESNDSFKSASMLTHRKSFGYLRNPSADVCKITETAETLFRANSHLFHRRNLIQELITKTFLMTAQNVFKSDEMSNHVLQQELFEDHKINLIKMIAKIYLEVRFLHEARRLNAKNPKNYIRQSYNRAVNIYYHQ